MVLKRIRNINLGWFLVLMGCGFILTGLSMTSDPTKGNTFLCFDAGCVTVQGFSSLALGVLMIGMGIYIRYFRYK